MNAMSRATAHRSAATRVGMSSTTKNWVSTVPRKLTNTLERMLGGTGISNAFRSVIARWSAVTRLLMLLELDMAQDIERQ